MNINQQAINETMEQFDRKGIHVYFCKESGSFKMLNSACSNYLFAKLRGYDSSAELLSEMNATYHAICGGTYTVETTLNTSTEVSLYLAKIGMKNSRVFKDGVEISPSEFETENE